MFHFSCCSSIFTRRSLVYCIDIISFDVIFPPVDFLHNYLLYLDLSPLLPDFPLKNHISDAGQFYWCSKTQRRWWKRSRPNSKSAQVVYLFILYIILYTYIFYIYIKYIYIILYLLYFIYINICYSLLSIKLTYQQVQKYSNYNVGLILKGIWNTEEDFFF